MNFGQSVEDLAEIGTRDAFHVPAVLVSSDDVLFPGANVRFTDLAQTTVRLCNDADRHGIADPFWRDAHIGQRNVIVPGTLFWVAVDPRLVKGVVHHFDIAIEPPAEADDEGRTWDAEPSNYPPPTEEQIKRREEFANAEKEELDHTGQDWNPETQEWDQDESDFCCPEDDLDFPPAHRLIVRLKKQAFQLLDELLARQQFLPSLVVHKAGDN